MSGTGSRSEQDAGGTAASVASASGSDRYTGRVLSYDSTRGLGWVVDVDAGADTDEARPVSVHYSELRPAWPDDKLAKRSLLFQGEYIEFGIGPNPKNPSRVCCKDVTGVGGGPLLMDHAVLKRDLRRSRDFDTRAEHAPDPADSRTGRVTSYHARKGWGWIRDVATAEMFFVHFSEIHYLWKDRLGAEDNDDFKPCLFTGEYVQFEVGANPFTGQTCAKRVTGPRQGPLLMDFGTYRYLRYRVPPASAGDGHQPDGHEQGNEQGNEHDARDAENNDRAREEFVDTNGYTL